MVDIVSFHIFADVSHLPYNVMITSQFNVCFAIISGFRSTVSRFSGIYCLKFTRPANSRLVGRAQQILFYDQMQSDR